MRTSTPDLLLALDFGGSLTKGLYQVQDGRPHVITMEPETVQTTRTALDGFMAHHLLDPPPEANAWVKFGAAEPCWAVGTLAKQLYAPAGLRGLKWERAIHKTLAAIWVIQQKLPLRSTFKVALACLLPPGEFEDRHHFEHHLRLALSNFETPTGNLRVKLNSFECRPECGGVARLYAQQQVQLGGMPELCAFIMLGYRNASLLLARRGRFGVGKTSDLGFVRCIEQIQQQTSGLQPDPLVQAIAEAEQTGNAVPYTRIVPYSDPELQKQAARRLVEVVAAAKVSYAQMVSAWLDEVLPLQEGPSLMFYGGTTDVMLSQLERYQPNLPHAYHLGVQLPADLEASGFGNRLADCYASFSALQQAQGWQVVPAVVPA